MRVTAHNRGPDAAELHILPTVWFRNTWAWRVGDTKPAMKADGPGRVAVEHPTLGNYIAATSTAMRTCCSARE